MQKNKNITNSSQKAHSKKTYVIIGASLALLLALLAGLELSDATHFFHTAKPATVTTASSETKGEKAPTSSAPSSKSSSSTTQPQTTPTNQPGDEKSTTEGTTTAALVAPSGDFVSAHGSSDRPLPRDASLSSVCNTTPGAVCKITFTSVDGVVVSLPTQTTDRGGSTYWNNWSPKSLGLTAGSWKITATASSAGQTKDSADALTLEIAP